MRRNLLFGQVLVYLLLSGGAVVMAFPFYWMLATSLKSPQEAQQARPIWIPERLKASNWQAAWHLGTQTGSSWWGGIGPGQSVTLRVYTPSGPPPQVSIPAPPGAFSDTRSEQTQIQVIYQVDHWAIRFSNQSGERFRTLPAVILVPKGYPNYTPELPPDATRSSGEY
jgi:multiple sugar transport system permease protein